MEWDIPPYEGHLLVWHALPLASGRAKWFTRYMFKLTLSDFASAEQVVDTGLEKSVSHVDEWLLRCGLESVFTPVCWRRAVTNANKKLVTLSLWSLGSWSKYSAHIKWNMNDQAECISLYLKTFWTLKSYNQSTVDLLFNILIFVWHCSRGTELSKPLKE